MKKTNVRIIQLLIVLAALFIVQIPAHADQLAYLKKADAEKAVRYLKKQSSIVLWCACCDNDKPVQLVKVSSVSYKYSGFENYYEITVKGITAAGETLITAIDLAYTHVKQAGLWMPVGKLLKMKCNPCVESFGMN